MSRWACFEQDRGCCGDFSCLVGSDLVLRIIAKIELRDLIRVRLVCKSWYDAVLSPQFLKIWKNEDERIWVVLAVRSDLKESQEEYEEHLCSEEYEEHWYQERLWYPAENHREVWYVSSSSSTLETQSVRSPCMLPVPPPCMLPVPPPNGTKFEGLLSSHGLVLARLIDYAEDSKHSIKLVVGNPVTNTWKPLPLAPLPPTISPYFNHQFSMELDPGSSGDYIIVIFLYPYDDYDDSDEEAERGKECLYHVLQYESKLGTWCTGPTLIECTTNHSHHMLNHGSMVGIQSLCRHGTPIFSVYDPVIMAWSHLHIAFSFELPLEENDDGDRRRPRCRILAGFKHGGKYFLTTSFFRPGAEDLGLGLGAEDLGLCVWELDQENVSWKLVSRRSFKDMYGAGWWSDPYGMNWKSQFVGEHVIFSTAYKPSYHGLFPPVAFNMHQFTWINALTEEEKCSNANFSRVIDYECAYAFIPSLAAPV